MTLEWLSRGNRPYGVAKKALLVQPKLPTEQYGFNGIYLLPVNLYGPEDNLIPQLPSSQP